MMAAQESEASTRAEMLAAGHATELLKKFGFALSGGAVASDHPALAWRRAGLMAVTGGSQDRGLVSPLALTAAADGALGAFRALAPGATLPINGAILLGERARMLGLRRRGRISPNGSCRLLRAKDGEFALNLPRPSDWELLPAWLCTPVNGWPQIEYAVARMHVAPLLARGRLLGLAIAPMDVAPRSAQPFALRRFAETAPRDRGPLVIDLSSLWAGPLAGALLHAAGAQVIKVECVRRPDGAREGHPQFFDLLNAGKASVALDFTYPGDQVQLRQLVAAADIVIESARPRALRRLGIHAEAMARKGGVWISITGHGGEGEAADWIGFGDDAAIAGGVASAMKRHWGTSMFAGDAVADPLTGVTAAAVGLAAWRAGGGWLASLSLSHVVAHAACLHEVCNISEWQTLAEADTAPLYPERTSSGAARALGADTARILTQLASRCLTAPRELDGGCQLAAT